jgi:hypothetical protein
MVLLPGSSGRFSVQTRQREDYEPADRPVKFYEFLLCIMTQALVGVGRYLHIAPAMPAAIMSIALLMAISLWKLLVPPRFSATRGAFLLAGVICIALLFPP